jgi:hypothetical protein
LDASPYLREKWGELIRILTEINSDASQSYGLYEISGSIPTSVSLHLGGASYSLTATTDTLANLLLSLQKAGIVTLRKT